MMQTLQGTLCCMTIDQQPAIVSELWQLLHSVMPLCGAFDHTNEPRAEVSGQDAFKLCSCMQVFAYAHRLIAKILHATQIAALSLH